jgi:hypothetical protein
MVGIAQLVERLIVVQEVAGSSPVTHPKQKNSPANAGLFLFKFAAGADYSFSSSETNGSLAPSLNE